MSGSVCAVAGAGAGVINPIPITSISDLAFAPADAEASLSMFSDGTYDKSNGGVGNWYAYVVTGIGALYWVRMTKTSGADPDTGTLNTWQQLSSTRSWTWEQTVVGAKVATVTLELALDAAGANIVASRTGISVDAEVA